MDRQTQAPASAQRTDTITPEPLAAFELNPLFQGEAVDTAYHVQAVLAALSVMEPVKDVNVEHLNFGLSLIHHWLANTLDIAQRYPRLISVIPVLPKTDKGGTS